MVRVAVYVDGFNLYYGLKAGYGRRYLWLDLQSLSTRLLRPGQRLQKLTYFTARVRNDPAGERRQSDYLDALTSHRPLVTLVNGRFQEKPRSCRGCAATWTAYEEKETDVNIAVTLLEDAVADRCDMALLISADSDLCPAIAAMKRIDPARRVIVAFPPRRHSADLKRLVDGYLHIGADKIRRSQLPNEVRGGTGAVLHRPKHWS
ncbi:NYN domain-containing protein [Pseudonocardia acaciae]|uniref:NYN domain-containing protein n=1 Tax=Pseudonocardia acaciae TaxID=551276 RepID=UPI00048D086A|nr:NYN domain-containing protein [Pseudonocardia acaciae]